MFSKFTGGTSWKKKLTLYLYLILTLPFPVIHPKKTTENLHLPRSSQLRALCATWPSSARPLLLLKGETSGPGSGESDGTRSGPSWLFDLHELTRSVREVIGGMGLSDPKLRY